MPQISSREQLMVYLGKMRSLRVRECRGQRVGAVVRLGYLSKPQVHTHHFLHLLLVGLAVACNCLLDLHRGVLKDSHAGLHAAQQYYAAGLRHRHSRSNIPGKKIASPPTLW